MAKEDAVRKWIKSNQISPNKKELDLLTILEKVVPNIYKINVKGEHLILGGKIPDFVCIPEFKIIELYGDYWHKDEDECIRIDYFKKYGYKTLIVWERELRYSVMLCDKIRDFHNKGF